MVGRFKKTKRSEVRATASEGEKFVDVDNRWENLVVVDGKLKGVDFGGITTVHHPVHPKDVAQDLRSMWFGKVWRLRQLKAKVPGLEAIYLETLHNEGYLPSLFATTPEAEQNRKRLYDLYEKHFDLKSSWLKQKRAKQTVNPELEQAVVKAETELVQVLGEYNLVQEYEDFLRPPAREYLPDHPLTGVLQEMAELHAEIAPQAKQIRLEIERKNGHKRNAALKILNGAIETVNELNERWNTLRDRDPKLRELVGFREHLSKNREAIIAMINDFRAYAKKEKVAVTGKDETNIKAVKNRLRDLAAEVARHIERKQRGTSLGKWTRRGTLAIGVVGVLGAGVYYAGVMNGKKQEAPLLGGTEVKQEPQQEAVPAENFEELPLMPEEPVKPLEDLVPQLPVEIVKLEPAKIREPQIELPEIPFRPNLPLPPVEPQREPDEIKITIDNINQLKQSPRLPDRDRVPHWVANDANKRNISVDAQVNKWQQTANLWELNLIREIISNSYLGNGNPAPIAGKKMAIPNFKDHYDHKGKLITAEEQITHFLANSRGEVLRKALVANERKNLATINQFHQADPAQYDEYDKKESTYEGLFQRYGLSNTNPIRITMEQRIQRILLLQEMANVVGPQGKVYRRLRGRSELDFDPFRRILMSNLETDQEMRGKLDLEWQTNNLATDISRSTHF